MPRITVSKPKDAKVGVLQHTWRRSDGTRQSEQQAICTGGVAEDQKPTVKSGTVVRLLSKQWDSKGSGTR